ncbi:MAG: NADH:ubiquinone reductase (Na(+)-transporting) subunit A [Crocinitomicaceae bacterium]|nr:NADH:ubiquinone reductase (Na(+)-transporting) subunit A [Crocinitomicaceae bacterium]
MGQNIKIRRGVDIKLNGAADQKSSPTSTSTVAIKPTDFHNLIPKLVVKQGDTVKAGSPIFYDKLHPEMQFVSPVSGEIAEVIRGEKRRILEVRVLADKETVFETHDVSNASNSDATAIKELLLKSGNWPLIKQRPFDIVADPGKSPKAIFVSAFDSAPLAPDYNFILKDRGEDLQTGIDALAKLTAGKVQVVTATNAGVFGSLKNCERHVVNGPHPAGNVGVQIHNIDPVNKGEQVWVVNPQDLAAMGSFLRTGKIDINRTVALTGSEVKAPQYFNVTLGTAVEALTKGNLNDGGLRVISGNVLTGDNVGGKGYLGFYHHQVTVIPEDDEPEFFGWIAPGLNKFSLSRTFFSWLTPNKKYNLGTSQHGEERAFVMSGEYEKVFPFDIYPVQLLKSMLVKDIDAMESLGVYEVAPEDFALCEFGCTSKIDVQEIVREGLDLIQKEC